MSWRPTAALGRALVLGAVGLVLALVTGEPALVVIAAPFVVLSALGLVHRPTLTPQVTARLDHRSLPEGQGTTSRLELDLSTVEPSVAGPRRPQDRIRLADLGRSFDKDLPGLVPAGFALPMGLWLAWRLWNDLRGRSSALRGSMAVALCSASRLRLMPGAITPPI